ncbi:MAG: hypothetical protein RIR70_354 [Pseudomonadota bacterium]|jgi:hypothetical protein
MASIDETRILGALANTRIESFSAELIAVQSCRDDDAIYPLLLSAIESEPFLLARVLRVANSATYSRCSVGPGLGIYECLLRIGVTQARRIADDFLIDHALGRIARANRLSRSVWREARLAGRISGLFDACCVPPFDEVGANLPVCLSYLGEIFVMSLAEAHMEIPKLTLPADGSTQPDLVELSVLAMNKLGIPKVFCDVLSDLPRVSQGREATFGNTAAVVLLSRALTKSLRPGLSFSAEIPMSSIEAALALLGISDTKWEELAVAAQAILKIPRSAPENDSSSHSLVAHR